MKDSDLPAQDRSALLIIMLGAGAKAIHAYSGYQEGARTGIVLARNP